jgi:hypothetical protein
MPLLLLVLFSIALSIGMGVIVIIVRRLRRPAEDLYPQEAMPDYMPSCLFRRPGSWLAIKSRSLVAVQSALRLHNVKPCTWTDGFAGEAKLFIAPPVKGWILVLGSGLPDPGDDVDVCFRFIERLSRKLGQVQFFSVNRALQHHAWVKADGGRVLRAYAWAGHTVWHQGPKTAAEKELAVICYDYSEPPERVSFSQPDPISANVDKVPLLAGRWSLDPARLDLRGVEAACGLAGEPSRPF